MHLKGTTLLKKIRYNRRRWDSIIESVIGKGLEIEPVNERWILKDVIAHISWYEKELLKALQRKTLADSTFWNTDVETRNSMIFDMTQNRTLNELLSESKEIYEQLLEEIKLISDADLNSEIYIRRKEGTRVTHDFIGGVTYWHWEDHEDYLINIFDLDY